MNKKKQIIDILLEEFKYIYCDNCRFQGDEENCENCHRKYISWSLHPSVAEALANRIIQLENSN